MEVENRWQKKRISVELAQHFDEAPMLTYICAVYGTALTISFWQRFEDWDRSLFLVLNHDLANPVFDTILPYFRESLFWAPLYLFIMAFMMMNFGKKGLWWGISFVATVAIADLLGTYAFKETIQRIRPCN